MNLFQPAEWAPHKSCWLAWPSHADLWQENLLPAQREFTNLCGLIAEGEPLNILVPDEIILKAAQERLTGLPVRFHLVPFGDIWLRDTAPIFMRRPTDGRIVACRFQFNGWGGKYVLPYDDQVSGSIAQLSGCVAEKFPFVLEGGAVDVDGEGTLLTTKQTMLNKNRNPNMSKDQIEKSIKDIFGVKKVLWLNEGLLNDHTDGHVDTIARFAGPGTVVSMRANGKDDPNADVLAEVNRDLKAFTDANGEKLKVIEVPSPGKVVDIDGRIMPASYVNFYISNSTVVVPTYGLPADDEAVNIIAACFPSRKTIGLSAKAILSGGGAFHCITQQEPLEGQAS